MYATIPVYYPSLEEAERSNERNLWLDSYKLNMACRNAIANSELTAFNSRKTESFIKDLVRIYGVERAMYVLSRTVQYRDWDTGFSEIVRSRANAFIFPDMQSTDALNAKTPNEKLFSDRTNNYYISQIDPCILDHIYLELMKIEIDNNMASHAEHFEILRDETDNSEEAEACL